MNRLFLAALTAVAFAAVPAASFVLPQVASAQWLQVQIQPPAPVVEVRTEAPQPTYVWAPGYWSWDGHAHVWVAGSWMAPRGPGYTWHEPQWQQHGHGWRFHRGHWGHGHGH